MNKLTLVALVASLAISACRTNVSGVVTAKSHSASSTSVYLDCTLFLAKVLPVCETKIMTIPERFTLSVQTGDGESSIADVSVDEQMYNSVEVGDKVCDSHACQ